MDLPFRSLSWVDGASPVPTWTTLPAASTPSEPLVYTAYTDYTAVLFGFKKSGYVHQTVRLSTKWGTLPRFVRIKIKGPALKAFRHGIKLSFIPYDPSEKF